MGRSVDLTSKLGLAPKPTIKIGDTVLTVNNTAENMLQILNIVGDGVELSASSIAEVAALLFDKKSAQALKKMELSFPDYETVVITGLDLIIGSDDSGEGETLDTTS